VLALTALGDPGGSVALTEIESPSPRENEAVVAQQALSLNRGEVRALRSIDPGVVLGWDAAGVVVSAARDGSGPPEGSRVIGIIEVGGWAERVAVPADGLTVIPDQLDVAVASTLPIAGLTALWALSIGGSLLGKRVLITGAAGGVGRLAVQLARRAGAYVTAVVRNAERAHGLVELGANEVVFDNDPAGERVDLVLESVGGASLAASLHRVAEGGAVILFGNSSDTNPEIDVEFYNRSRGAMLYAFNIGYERPHRDLGSDLAWLAGEALAGRLDAQITTRSSWRHANEILGALADRSINGKAVLDVD
jgi:NADPH:quinone reductase